VPAYVKGIKRVHKSLEFFFLLIIIRDETQNGNSDRIKIMEDYKNESSSSLSYSVVKSNRMTTNPGNNHKVGNARAPMHYSC